MRGLALLSMLLLCSAPFASFTYLYSLNGSYSGDSDESNMFSLPSGVLYAADHLFVADTGKSALYGFNGTTRDKFLSNIGGLTRFTNPLRMKYFEGTLYIADGVGTRIKTYSGTGPTVENWNEASNMRKPSAIEFDANYAYISDLSTKQVYRYSRATRSYVSIAIPYGPSDGELSAPADIHLYKGKFYVSDQQKGMIFVYDSNFTFLSAIGRGRGGVTLTSPRGFEINQDRIFVADASSNRVVVFTMDGYPIEILNSSTAEGDFAYPEDVTIDGAGNTLYVADTINRLVKAFSINITSGNDSVMQAITLAKFSLGQLQSVQKAASMLNVSFEETSAAGDIAKAESDYSNYMFSSASVLADKAHGESVAAQAAVEQGVSVKILQLSKTAQDRVAPFRPKATGSLAPLLTQFDNRVADVNAKLSSKAYSSAADAALALGPSAEGLIASIQNNSAAQIELGNNQTASGYLESLSALDNQVASLTARAAAYHQEVNFSNAQKLIASAQSAAQEGDFEAANYSLSLASLEVNSSANSLEQVISEIDSAAANFTLTELEFNSTVGKGTLIPADVSSQRALMAQARETMYSNPQLGLAMARRAADEAASKVKDAQALSLAAAAVVSIIGGMLLIAGAFFIHLMRRRNRARHPEEEHHHEEEGHHQEEHRRHEEEAHRHRQEEREEERR